jgi:hypothetical protein
MSTHAGSLTVLAIIVPALAVGGSLVAQSALAQLGLSEAAARAFVLAEVKSQAGGRRSPIAVAGNRAFYKLPPAARGPAATALFAWAKAYVNSPAFRTAYATFREGVIPREPQYAQTVDEAVRQEVDNMRAGIAQLKQAAASMAPAERASLLDVVAQQEAQFENGELAKVLRTNLEAERAAQATGDTEAAHAANERYPADPRLLFARRLREFLADTADANFSAPTISLTGGAEGIELVDPEDRKKPWMWQAAVIVGPEATTAARTAAASWLKEMEP